MERRINKLQNPVVWDCGSSLYDSFELNSLKRQLDSAIVSRTLSMPHLQDRRAPPPPKQPLSETAMVVKKSSSSSSKISRSFNRLLKSLFRRNSSSVLKMRERYNLQEGNCVVLYDKTGALTTIPEGPAIDLGGGISPDINSLTKRSVSERFTASSIAISCA